MNGGNFDVALGAMIAIAYLIILAGIVYGVWFATSQIVGALS